MRDPLGSVTRDGVTEDGAQVYVNFSDDVLLEDDNPPGGTSGQMTLTLIQHDRPIGLPRQVTLPALARLLSRAPAPPRWSPPTLAPPSSP